jgi:hypothetical protein
MKIEPRIEKLFMCMAAAKPMKFTGAYPTEGAVNVAKIVWQNGLKDLSDEEIAAGIKALADWMPENGEDKLPTVTEFKILLCPRIPRERPRLDAPTKEFKPASRETVKKCWEGVAKHASGKLGATVNKILQRYE